MPFYTLGQAAKATGRSKAGILNAIKNGRLSASRDDKNQWQIDPAELHRVYPAVNLTPQIERELTPTYPPEPSYPAEKIAALERIIGTLENERDDLRRRLDQSESERREAQHKLTALLTHQPEPPAQLPQSDKGRLWRKLFSRP